MTPSPAWQGALLRALALCPQPGPRLRSHLRAAAGGACAVLLGLLVALVLAPGDLPSLASVSSRPSVGPSGPSADGGAGPLVADAAGRAGAAARSLG